MLTPTLTTDELPTLTTDELVEATDAVKWPAKATNKQRDEYRAKIKALETQWAAWLDVEYGSYIPSEFRKVIFQKAWSDGHSSGYRSVEEFYEVYSEFAGAAIRSHILEGYEGYDDYKV